MLRKGRCARCGHPFRNDEGAVLANGRLFHLNHLCCSFCDRSLGQVQDGFVLQGSGLACSRCLLRLSPSCRGCGQAILEQYIVNDGHLYHRNCFKCARCHRILNQHFFMDDDGRLLDRDCLWGQLLMDHIVRDTANIVPINY